MKVQRLFIYLLSFVVFSWILHQKASAENLPKAVYISEKTRVSGIHGSLVIDAGTEVKVLNREEGILTIEFEGFKGRISEQKTDFVQRLREKLIGRTVSGKAPLESKKKRPSAEWKAFIEKEIRTAEKQKISLGYRINTKKYQQLIQFLSRSAEISEEDLSFLLDLTKSEFSVPYSLLDELVTPGNIDLIFDRLEPDVFLPELGFISTQDTNSELFWRSKGLPTLLDLWLTHGGHKKNTSVLTDKLRDRSGQFESFYDLSWMYTCARLNQYPSESLLLEMIRKSPIGEDILEIVLMPNFPYTRSKFFEKVYALGQEDLIHKMAKMGHLDSLKHTLEQIQMDTYQSPPDIAVVIGRTSLFVVNAYPPNTSIRYIFATHNPRREAIYPRGKRVVSKFNTNDERNQPLAILQPDDAARILKIFSETGESNFYSTQLLTGCLYHQEDLNTYFTKAGEFDSKNHTELDILPRHRFRKVMEQKIKLSGMDGTLSSLPQGFPDHIEDQIIFYPLISLYFSNEIFDPICFFYWLETLYDLNEQRISINRMHNIPMMGSVRHLIEKRIGPESVEQYLDYAPTKKHRNFHALIRIVSPSWKRVLRDMRNHARSNAN